VLLLLQKIILKKYYIDTIERDELKVLIVDIGTALNSPHMINITDQQIEEAFNRLDIDQNGVISYSEFKSWFDQLMSGLK
jgi:Ca2+-binding EF-hand superfamily protein